MASTTHPGDGGQTSLRDGSEVAKSHGLLEVLGDLDECSCAIGTARAFALPDGWEQRLLEIQGELLQLGARLGESYQEGDSDAPWPTLVDEIQDWHDATVQALPELTHFIMPGGDPAASALHTARAVCRRAERHLVGYANDVATPSGAIAYLNRLSDLLFVLGRASLRAAGVAECIWIGSPPALDLE